MILEITLPGDKAPDALNDMMGLREHKRGVTEGRKVRLGQRRRKLRGGFAFVALENPELTAVAVVRSRQRRENLKANTAPFVGEVVAPTPPEDSRP